MPLIETKGAASAQGFGGIGGGSSGPVNYIEDVFSTYLYTGNGSTQTITNGIDLAGEGGLVWVKQRDAAFNHIFTDTARGVSKFLYSDQTNAQETYSGYGVTAFNSTGFAVTDTTVYGVNKNAATYVSWTFREQPKFFDIVTYTGNGSNRTISHSLGSTPGCIIVKRTDTSANWQVYHRSLTSAAYSIQLNLGNAEASATTVWNSTAPTSTVFSVGTDSTVNANGGTYVAYLFAHNAGGFGLSGSDNVISCGAFTTDGSGNATVNLGYEPQWVVIKQTSPENWFLNDIMRGMPAPPSGTGNNVNLFPNTSAAESIQGFDTSPTATGFAARTGNPSRTYIYIAIRRGPMKVPTSGTSVFSPLVANNAQGTKNTTDFPVDMQLAKARSTVIGTYDADRLRGVSTTSTTGGAHLITSSTAAEASTNATQFWDNTGFQTSSGWASTSMVYWNFRRAPSFFDEVCYTGDGTSARNITHNLTVSPELVIIKARSRVDDWVVRSSAFPTSGSSGIAYLNLTTQVNNAGYSYVPTATTFQIDSNFNQNQSGQTYVAYLFATCAGVSKIGSYTGTGALQTINCGFTSGARFVLIKATSTTGDWYVWDSARGITASTDPYLVLNSTAAEVTTTNWVDTDSTGFKVTAAGGNLVNTNGTSYIFLSVA